MNFKATSLSSFLTLLLVGSLFFGVTSCLFQVQDHRFAAPTGLTQAAGPPVAAGLRAPVGLTEDPQGNVWVTEAGSGTVNNGQVSVITPSGTFAAITGFTSAVSPENSPEGLNHLTYKDGKLYILHGLEGKLYIVDVTSFVPGVSTPIAASSLTGIDIGTFVRDAYPNAPDPKNSNLYDLTFGPNGDLFMVDAGANAIIRRNKDTGALSVYAVFPDFFNPGAPVGPPTVDAVPTGIVLSGTDFYISTLSGGPFPAGVATIYKVNATSTGPVTPMVHKSGFTGMTNIELTPSGVPIVTEFGFSGAGRVARGDEPLLTLFSPAITPVDIHLSKKNSDTYYLLYYGPGILVKLTATR
jgi:hypothetical protein